MSNRSTRLALVGILVLGLTPFAGAQERRLTPGDTAVPLSLFLAYVNQPNMYYMTGGGGETVVHVGRIPAALEARIPQPVNSRVLGTVSSALMDFISLETDASIDSVRTWIARELPKRGWRTTRQAGGGGFRPAAIIQAMWCGESSMLAYNVERVTALRTRVSYSLRQDDMGACGSRNARPREQLPLLFNPEDAQEFTSACNSANSSGMLGMNTAGTIASQMTPEQLLDHYGKQLLDSGWTIPSSRGEGASATRRWLKRQSDGTLRSVSITVFVPAGKPTCRILEMRVEGPR